MKQTLRPYQQRAIEKLREGFRSGKRRICLVAPTGAGKTSIAAEMISGAIALDRRVLFVAHRKELVEQASVRLDGHGVHEHGIIMASHPRLRPGAPVQVCSVQTLIRRQMPRADLVIIDECAHAAAQSYERIYREYPDAWYVGLTATPWRLDGRGLADLFDDVVVVATPKQLIAEGYLCGYSGFRYVAPDTSKIKTIAGEFDKHGLETACGDSAIIGSVVGEWLKHASGLRTIVFAVSIAHAQRLKTEFELHGILAVETIDHLLSMTERTEMMARVRSGTTQVIINVAILTEGLDIPELECAVLARPTKSLALYLQMVGRVLRPSPGKTLARIHDHGGCVERHGLPDAERDYSLQASRKTNPSNLTGLTTCPSCFAIYDGAEHDVCPGCGLVPVVREPREPKREEAGVAVDLRADLGPRAPFKEMAEYRERLVRECIETGRKSGWIIYAFKKRYPLGPLPWSAWRRVKQMRGE